MNQDFFMRNRAHVASRVKDNSILILFSGKSVQKSADELYPFSVNRNFYYLTGLDYEGAILLVEKKDAGVKETLFIEAGSEHKEKWNGKMLTSKEAKEISGVEQVKYLENFYPELERYLRTGKFTDVYLDLERYGWNVAVSLEQSFAEEIKSKYPHILLNDIYHQICELRTRKYPEEVELIRKALECANSGFQSMLSNTHIGVMEYELEAHFDFAIKRLGSKMAYAPIVGGGINATIMHYIKNNQEVKDGDLILADVGAEYHYYKSDITRTFPANGRFSARQRKIYDIVLKAELDTIACIKPGVRHGYLNEVTCNVLAQGLRDLGVIVEDSELEKYYFYNVSHYLGLDTHDVGAYDVLRPGMVLTVEPGIYLPDESLGIRIEDNVLVTEDGYEILSKDIIRTADEIEAFMAAR
ncbi:aminopeptidase P family protein [Alicyclobacillus fastidiosus]|uniref:Xaa-Pro aminopeptidase n=1 Tax=Alicyclobacillus fastidiosus TaxID=392011 RepID=A0ABY6ZC82_9BACL|nr:aminopeptidase P family protein [Alicyclobacillus fastidiosus]WAH40500.1 aminopeptidase P family protein [Alicyclobacillus fastidiosus]GMA61916.1 Xaa-Pro aminopeptidase [Alicyclobacillus fastidiosus]